MWLQLHISSLFQKTGSGSLRSSTLIRAHKPVHWQAGGPAAVNDDAAKRQRDVINDRADTGGTEEVDPSLQPLTCWRREKVYADRSR